MFKLDRKLIISASIATAAALFAVGCGGGASATPTGSTMLNGKPTIDGGSTYQIENGYTSDYAVNEDAIKGSYNFGRTPTANELAAWDTDVTPSKLPPKGSGSVEDGEEIYEAQCVMCHGDFGSGGGGYPALSKGNAVDLQKTLTNNRYQDPDADGPTREFGSYWPQASTMWWYIHDGMPHPKTKSLSVDEVYALTAYILNINEMEIDGVEVDDEYVLDQAKFAKIVMPNVDGFEPNIDGPNALEDVRTYYANAANFGAQNLNQGAVRCMKDCQEKTVKVARINGGITDFLPPMSTVRDLPEEKGAVIAGASDYEASCAVCHGAAGMGAPVVGNHAEWSKVAAKGTAAVLANAINGINGMPPRGGTDLSDAKMKDVVNFMLNSSK